MKPRRWDGRGLRTIREEKIHRFVGIRKSVAIGERRKEIKHARDGCGQSLGHFVCGFNAPFRKISYHLTKFSRETVGGAQQESIITAARDLKPMCIVALCSANHEYTARVLAGRYHPIRAAAVLEHNKVLEPRSQAGHKFWADFILRHLGKLIKRDWHARFEHLLESFLHLGLRYFLSARRANCETANPRFRKRLSNVTLISARLNPINRIPNHFQ